ncbi:MAG TPA: MXAN_5187 C-terminal domain-containing protein [Kofleriaceae bacterium]|nr:MXAN_5187 C-terminal domain-containing protein [Kofleriaceae bacterium]
MALKSAQEASVTLENVEETLDTIDKNLERVKTLYEQYFLGIQKQPPAFLHTDIERKLRDLTQLQVRNTGLRYRLATLQQKFGAYNSYWKRTLRQIENGTYIRNLSKIGREAARSGADIPEEILAAMPKRMREQVLRDREQALAIARRRKLEGDGQVPDDELLTLAPVAAPSVPPPPDELAAVIKEPTALRRELKTRTGAYVLDEADADVDLDSFFEGAFEDEEATKQKPVEPAPAPAPAAAAKPAPAPAPAKPIAPSQVTRPNPIVPGAAAARGPVSVEQAATPGTTGYLPKIPVPVTVPKVIPPIPKPATGPIPQPAAAKPAIPAPAPVKPAPAAPAPRPPPGMSDADVNALYAKYVQAKQAVGETVGPDGRHKLLKTINAQAPKIMEQYKAKGVDFSVVVKDNQVIIRAKPKT